MFKKILIANRGEIVRLAFGIALLIGAANRANACSFSWGPGNSPKEIPYRSDVELVKGRFTFVDGVTGADVTGGEFRLDKSGEDALGRIDRKGRRSIKTRSYYSQFWIDCGGYLGPPGVVTGKFWIEKRSGKDGRRRLLMWKPE